LNVWATVPCDETHDNLT